MYFIQRDGMTLFYFYQGERMFFCLRKRKKKTRHPLLRVPRVIYPIIQRIQLLALNARPVLVSVYIVVAEEREDRRLFGLCQGSTTASQQCAKMFKKKIGWQNTICQPN